MTVYYVDDGGSATAPYDTWAKAATSLSALDDAVAFASDDIVYIGHDHVCQYVHAASRTITGPTTGRPTIIISATTGSDPPAYQKSATDQVDTSEGAYGLTFDGSFALHGVRMKCGTADPTFLNPDNDEAIGFSADCTMALGAGRSLAIGGANASALICLKNFTIDLTADGTTPRSAVAVDFGNGIYEINGLAFVNAAYRTGTVLRQASGAGRVMIDGADFSGFTNATNCEIVGAMISPRAQLVNCLTKSSPTLINAATSRYPGNEILLVNVGPVDDPIALTLLRYGGDLVSSTAIVRTGGASIEDIACSWLVTTTANCGENAPFYSPWIYGHITTTGSKTFDVCITNDTADFTDAEVWMEVEYMGAADSPLYTLGSDQRATITTTPAAQTDDTTSTWTGAGPSYTYKQKLSVTATVNETGLYRARVAVGVTSIASSRYFYVDPKVTVS